jgi:polyisoprenoid-binding protein YceI
VLELHCHGLFLLDSLRRVSTYTLGPEDGTLSVRTGRAGTVAKAGHDLLIHVKQWSATLDLDAPRVTLDADATSLHVIEGTGGMKGLDHDDHANIRQTIDEQILRRHDVEFRSTEVERTDAGLAVRGDLTLVGTTRPVAFDLSLADGRVSGTAVVTQTEFGMKPYSALFGALKVADEVRVEIDAALPQSL